MRKNTMQVFDAWTRCEECRKCRSIWTSGLTIYSYRTAIATFGNQANEVYFNRTKYSPTTSTHQNALRILMARKGYNVVEVDGQRIGVTGLQFFIEGRSAAGWTG